MIRNHLSIFFLFLFIIFLNGYFHQPAWCLVGGGGISIFPGSMQTDKEGGASKTSFNPFLQIHHSFKIWDHHFIHPRIGLIFYRGTSDYEYEKRGIFFLYNMSFVLTERFLLHYGLGTFWTMVSGEGRPVVLNNGNGTATFYQPGDTKTSYNSTVNLGLEFYFDKNYALTFDNYIFSILSSTKRDFSYSLSLNYYYN